MIKFDVFESIQHVRPQSRCVEYEQFAQIITYFEVVNNKEDRKECFSFTVYYPGKTRGKDNIQAMTGVVLDFDNKEGTVIPIEKILNFLENSCIQYFWYHTFSHSKDLLKWRLILPFNTEVPVKDWDDIYERTLQFLGNPNGIDPASQRTAQLYYFPYARTDNDVAYEGGAYKGVQISPYSLPILKEKKALPSPLPLTVDLSETPQGKVFVRKKITQDDIEKAKYALDFISPDIEYNDWIKIGMALHGEFGIDGFYIWDSWSAKGQKYKNSKETVYHWNTFKKSGLNIGTILFMAKERGYFCKNDKLGLSRERAEFAIQEDVAFTVEEITDVALKKLDRFITKDIFEIPCPLVKELYIWIEACAKIHQPLYSLSTTLSIMAFLKRNSIISPTKIKTNLYILAMGPSRSGKNNGLERIYEVMKELKLDHHLTSGVGSHQGMLKQMTENQGALYWKQDELAYIFKGIQSNYSNTNEQKIEQKLLTLYNCRYQTTDTIKSDKSEYVKDPFLNVYSTSTEQLLDILKPQSAVSGLLARFLIFWVPPGLPYEDNLSPLEELPLRLKESLQEVIKEKVIRTAIFEKEASDWFRLFLKEVRLVQRDLSEARTLIDSLVGNLPEQATKVALLSTPKFRASTNEKWPYIRLEDIQWGVAVAFHCLKNNIVIAQSFSENANEKVVKKIREQIKKKTRGGEWISKSQLWQNVKYIANSRQLDEILDLLAEGGDIERAPNLRGTGYKVRLRPRNFLYEEGENE
jgi:hypothetical protein